MSTIHAMLNRQAERFGACPLIAYPRRLAEAWDEPRDFITYEAAVTRVEALRAAYAAAGYGAGHRVALQLENRPLHYLHFLALNALGASVVPINPDYRADEIAYLLAHSDSVLVVTLPDHLAPLCATAARAAHPPSVT